MGNERSKIKKSNNLPFPNFNTDIQNFHLPEFHSDSKRIEKDEFDETIGQLQAAKILARTNLTNCTDENLRKPLTKELHIASEKLRRYQETYYIDRLKKQLPALADKP